MTGHARTRLGSVGLRVQRSRGFTVVELLVVLAVIGVLVALLLLPSVRTGGEAARRTQCKNNLKQIGLALHNYHDAYGALPPAYTVDAGGKPLHSWRTLILPFLEQKPLYDRIDLSKPWDDPVNAVAHGTNLPIFQCPSASASPGRTRYLAVAAEEACFRPTAPRPFAEITDGLANTLMVIEVDAGHEVHWMAPFDADAEAILGLGAESDLSHAGGTQVLFADGGVQFLSANMPASEREALISVAGDDGNRISQ